MRIIQLMFGLLIVFAACKTTRTVSSTTTSTTPTPVPTNTAQPMHVTPKVHLENEPSTTSPLLIGTWVLDTLVAEGNAIALDALPNKSSLQFTGTGLMIVKGTDQKEQFYTYTYKDNKITTIEPSTDMNVKVLNSRNLVVWVILEGKEVKMVYKKK